jgi:uncharacterized membrane protein YhaH (DUF805 family)
MGFGDAVSTCFAKYATFSGRAIRPEYWYWILFNILVSIGLAIIGLIVEPNVGNILSGLFDLAVLIPGIAVACRRLHDTDRSGWWQLLGFVPVVGWIILLVWFCQPGTPGTNRFG